MTRTTITKGFIAAGLVNITSAPLFSKLFTNDVLMQADPEVMGKFGLIMIMVWGVAFIAAAKNYASMKWLVGAFALEKLSYVIAYAVWFSKNSISEVYDKDALAGVFYSVYGLNDFLFFLFFCYVFFIAIPKGE